MKKLASLLTLGLLVFGCIPGSALAAESNVTYQTHIQNIGWEEAAGIGLKHDGEMSGTEGKSYRLEGIKIQTNIEGVGVAYQTHIQNIGWEYYPNQEWHRNGIMSGTEGKSYRLEAIQIKLTGLESGKYDIYYKVHAQNIGWMAWAKNGESAGTEGFGFRLEGIRIVIVPKGEKPPVYEDSNSNTFVKKGFVWNRDTDNWDIANASDGRDNPWGDGTGKGESQ